MMLLDNRVAHLALVFALLWAVSPVLACDKCHALAGGGCAPGCTCCGHANDPVPTVDPSDLPPPEAGVIDVAMLDYQFVPDSLAVTPGTTVRWTNLDDTPHNTISADALWQSEYLAPQQSFEYTFTDDSFQTFAYYCSLHGGMTGSITVVAPEPASGLIIASIFGCALYIPGRHSRSARSGI